MNKVDLSFLSKADRRHFRVIAEENARGNVVLFCGAGFSFNAQRVDGLDRRLPSWIDLANNLAAELPGLSDSGRDGYESVLDIADLFETTYGRQRLLSRILEIIPDRKYVPSEVHRLVPHLTFKEVITTNFDTLLERAFEEEQITPKVVVSDVGLVSPNRPRVIKVNGCGERNPEGIVITRDDFRRYDHEHPLFNSFLTGCFVESLVLFIGFSLDDPAFDAIYGRVRDVLGRNGRTAYSLQGHFPPERAESWARRGVRVLNLLSGPGDEGLSHGARLRCFLNALHDDQQLRNQLGSVGSGKEKDFIGQTWDRLRTSYWDDGSGAENPSKHQENLLLKSVAMLIPSAKKCWDRGGFLSKKGLNVLRKGFKSARKGEGRLVWQRSVHELLGRALGIGMHGPDDQIAAFKVPWFRQVVGLLVDSLKLGCLKLGKVNKSSKDRRKLFPEAVVLANQASLFLSVWDPVDDLVRPKARDSFKRLLETIHLLDARCLLVTSATLQRDALFQILIQARAEEMIRVLDLLEGGRIDSKCVADWNDSWTPDDGTARKCGGDSIDSSADGGHLLDYLANQVERLPADATFRFRHFLTGQPLRNEYRKALDWLRRRAEWDNAKGHETARFNIARRFVNLYDDPDLDGSRDSQASFYEPTAERFRGLVEKKLLRSRRELSKRPVSIAENLHRTFHSLLRGGLNLAPPPELVDALSEARRSLEEARWKEVSWPNLLHMTLIFEMEETERRELFARCIERGVLDYDYEFLLEI